ncbi:LytTR family DNA-binding domain-containing protein [Olivibacter ginsenosidimutans]|uniref:LytTR family DNA-binding domain-containing protein n=1 Tax=Olivibacter ginsenosidimutans TaxID=1176537 RepID=A0ABP9BER2_9SPHI
MILNCIAIDDEPLALGLIVSFIEKTPFLKLVGQYASAIEALEGIDQLDIQLIFLDIHMPELTGMEFSKIINQSKSNSKIIFTTAFNQFAVEGYKVDALFYLLKPFDYAEFLEAANKGKLYFETLNSRLTTQDQAKNERFLFVKADYKLIRIELEHILYVESIKDYVKIHLKDKADPIVSLSTLKGIEEKLPENEFIRIHRSFIVAVNQIDAIGRNSIHIGKLEIPVGDLYKDTFKQLIQKWG